MFNRTSLTAAFALGAALTLPPHSSHAQQPLPQTMTIRGLNSNSSCMHLDDSVFAFNVARDSRPLIAAAEPTGRFLVSFGAEGRCAEEFSWLGFGQDNTRYVAFVFNGPKENWTLPVLAIDDSTTLKVRYTLGNPQESYATVAMDIGMEKTIRDAGGFVLKLQNTIAIAPRAESHSCAAVGDSFIINVPQYSFRTLEEIGENQVLFRLSGECSRKYLEASKPSSGLARIVFDINGNGAANRDVPELKKEMLANGNMAIRSTNSPSISDLAIYTLRHLDTQTVDNIRASGGVSFKLAITPPGF